MRTSFSVAAALLSAVATAQTFTSCNPLEKTCPSDPALGTTQVTDFTAGADDFWSEADGTTLSYGSNGAEFVINKATDAPTISAAKYIMFGKVTVVTRASPGVGIVSSFILESDDLDEIDWEWLGGTSSSVESNFFGKGNTTSYDRATYVPVADAIKTWHTYTIDWTAEAINWYVDGANVRTLSYGDPLAVYGQNYPQTPMKVKMGSWVGCASAAAAADPKTAGTCSWAGGPADFSAAPFTMYVKSVTVEDYGCGTSYTYGDNSGSYQSIKATGGCKGGVTKGGSSDSSAAPSSTSASTSASTKATTSAAKTTSTKATSAAAPSSTTSASSSDSPSTVASTGLTSPSSTTSSAPVPTNAAGQLKRLGAMDYAVGALGLGLGYLVM